MADTSKKPKAAQEAEGIPAQEPEINEVDGEPIYHADEEGDGNE